MVGFKFNNSNNFNIINGNKINSNKNKWNKKCNRNINRNGLNKMIENELYIKR